MNKRFKRSLTRISKRLLTKKEMIKYFYIRKQVFDIFENKCFKCESKKELQLDHIKPLSKFPEEGFNIENMQILCKACNKIKSNSNSNDYRTTDDILSLVEFINCHPNKEKIKKIGQLSFLNQAGPSNPKCNSNKENKRKKKKNKSVAKTVNFTGRPMIEKLFKPKTILRKRESS